MKIQIAKVARYHDEAKGEARDEFVFRKTNGTRGRLTLLLTAAENPRELIAALKNAGARLPAEQHQQELLANELIKAKPKKEVRFTARAGWHNKGRSFIRATGAIGHKAESFGGVSPSRQAAGFPSHALKGSALGWRNSVAAIGQDSSIAMLTISTAFAAPLLHFVNYPSFALCIYAPSRSGKTGVTLAAASVIGLQNIITWNTTDAALEQSFALSNDCVLPVDDLSGKSGSPKALYGEFRALAHLITSGSGKKRHNYFGATTGVGHDSWRTIAITSREDSIANLARQLRQEREIGEAVRLIDVPALLSGHNNIFDRAKTPLKASEVTARLGRLYRACALQHGHVFELYIVKLAKRRGELEARINTLSENFVKQNILESDENVFRDLAKKFGIIYAGGHLATEFGLTGWSKKELHDAISKAFIQAKTYFPDPTANLKRGLVALSRALDALPKKKEVDERGFGSSAGYRTTYQSRIGFVIQIQKFGEIFETTEQTSRVLEFLREHKFIKMKRPKSGRETTSPKEQCIWPDGKRRRSYQLTLPTIDDWKACLKVRRTPAK